MGKLLAWFEELPCRLFHKRHRTEKRSSLFRYLKFTWCERCKRRYWRVP